MYLAFAISLSFLIMAGCTKNRAVSPSTPPEPTLTQINDKSCAPAEDLQRHIDKQNRIRIAREAERKGYKLLDLEMIQHKTRNLQRPECQTQYTPKQMVIVPEKQKKYFAWFSEHKVLETTDDIIYFMRDGRKIYQVDAGLNHGGFMRFPVEYEVFPQKACGPPPKCTHQKVLPVMNVPFDCIQRLFGPFKNSDKFATVKALRIRPLRFEYAEPCP